MVRKRDFFQGAALSLGQQVGRMSALHPEFRKMVSRNRASWRGQVQPSPTSSVYTIEIQYAHQRRPRVRVLQPPLRTRQPQEAIPHIFSDGSLCLHLNEDWSPMMFIADTIIPWASLWLFYYEVWHAVGEWLGGGQEPRRPK